MTIFSCELSFFVCESSEQALALSLISYYEMMFKAVFFFCS